MFSQARLDLITNKNATSLDPWYVASSSGLRIMHLSGGCRSMYRPASRSTIDRYIGRYVGRYSVSTLDRDVRRESVESRPSIDRYIGRVMIYCRSSIGQQIDLQSAAVASVPLWCVYWSWRSQSWGLWDQCLN